MDSKNFWVSWYADPGRSFELRSPWWVSGETGQSTTIVAAIKAHSEDEARDVVRGAHDDPPAKIRWRYVTERPDDWSPFNDRFPRDDWMEW